jgi:hypothetical protein
MISIGPSASRLTPQHIGDRSTAILAPEINIDLRRLAPRLDDEQITNVQFTNCILWICALSPDNDDSPNE